MKSSKRNLKWPLAVVLILFLTFVIGTSGGDQQSRPHADKHPARICKSGDFTDCSTQCQAGSGDSCAKLGIIYVNGIGIKPDKLKAGQLYKKACQMNSAEGCYDYYSALLYGVGLPANGHLALQTADKACRLGHQKSCSIVKLNRSLGTFPR